MSELSELERRKVYQLVVVRIVFPNKAVVELKCKPNETVRQLYLKV